MNKKYILGGVLFVFSALLILGGAWIYADYKQQANVRGKHTFAATYDKTAYLGRINITTPESGEINIYRTSDGSWRFKEANDYYINKDALASFYKMIKNSVIVTVQPADENFLAQHNLSDENGTKIKTYDFEGNLLDDVILGKRESEPEEYLVAARKGNNPLYAYAISSAGDFFGAAQAWIPYPLLNIKTSEIREVAINQKKVDYQEFNSLLKRSSAWRNFAGALDFLDYQGLAYKSDLSNLPTDAKIRQIDVLMLTGMFYKLTVLNVSGSYWIVISMDAQKVFGSEAIKVASETYKYYADWVFRLSDKQGKALFEETLTD